MPLWIASQPQPTANQELLQTNRNRAPFRWTSPA